MPGRHDRRTQAMDEGRRHLRRGIARCAQQVQATGAPQVDCVGRPMRYSNEMAERHSPSQVDRLARGWDVSLAAKPTARWCGTCKDAGRDPFQPLGHRCDA